MRKEDQKQFVDDLIASITTTLHNRLPDVPEDWKGAELRLWVVETCRRRIDERWAKRFLGRGGVQKYNNDVLIKNL